MMARGTFSIDQPSSPGAELFLKYTYSIGGENNNLADTAIKGLGSLVGALLCDQSVTAHLIL